MECVDTLGPIVSKGIPGDIKSCWFVDTRLRYSLLILFSDLLYLTVFSSVFQSSFRNLLSLGGLSL